MAHNSIVIMMATITTTTDMTTALARMKGVATSSISALVGVAFDDEDGDSSALSSGLSDQCARPAMSMVSMPVSMLLLNLTLVLIFGL